MGVILIKGPILAKDLFKLDFRKNLTFYEYQLKKADQNHEKFIFCLEATNKMAK